MNESKVVIALLAGLAAGAVLGIMFAPEAGTETRDKLNESLSKLGESIKDAASEQIDNLVGSIKEQVLTPMKEKLEGAGQESQSDDLEHA